MHHTSHPEGPGTRLHGSQVAVPCWLLRGGTSRGPFFRAADLPADPAARDAVLLAALGSPDPRQIDGLGGATPLTSKAGIVGPSSRPGIDLEFRFAQLQPDSDRVDTTANCGNMLAAVVPFALEAGLLAPEGDLTTARVLTLNTGLRAEIRVRTPADAAGRRHVAYEGSAHVDGVPGTASPVEIAFLDTAGSVCAELLPTGRVRDRVCLSGLGTVEVTCIDNGMPLVLVAASALGRTGRETVAELDADRELTDRLEELRLACGELMGLGDVTGRNYPKMTLISPPASGGTLSTRSFIPHVCHTSIGVLAAVTAATACVLEGSVAHELAAGVTGTDAAVSVEHPSGEFTVTLGLDTARGPGVTRAALVRTARLLMAGDVLVPRHTANREEALR
ncbi:4-oxalomesaconate tautomerase [Streptomyces reniochalinae]|uniref:4-oxalomesaconate tautomerase n=1 Tax=Streptomyces reniochalinae TaxID=2250578 RepID=A0A367EJU4_9ACTN|nr:4-oxalomesaconate tautomerase [Streptomyces reniochalinae]RCG17470.1 4-oxalomesaconate tautomerase [Streptomyces reniochalinae]